MKTGTLGWMQLDDGREARVSDVYISGERASSHPPGHQHPRHVHPDDVQQLTDEHAKPEKEHLDRVLSLGQLIPDRRDRQQEQHGPRARLPVEGVDDGMEDLSPRHVNMLHTRLQQNSPHDEGAMR